MEERDTIFQALARSSRLLGLPYENAVLALAICVLPLIWFISIWTLIWCAVVYGVLRWAAERDDKLIKALMLGSAAVPPTQSRKQFGGDSYGP